MKKIKIKNKKIHVYVQWYINSKKTNTYNIFL